MFVPQLAQSVIELNNQIQQKDKEIQSNEAKSVSRNTHTLQGVCVREYVRECVRSLIYFVVSVSCLSAFRMLEYQQQIASLEGDCRDLRSHLQVGNQLGNTSPGAEGFRCSGP